MSTDGLVLAINVKVVEFVQERVQVAFARDLLVTNRSLNKGSWVWLRRSYERRYSFIVLFDEIRVME